MPWVGCMALFQCVAVRPPSSPRNAKDARKYLLYWFVFGGVQLSFLRILYLLYRNLDVIAYF